MLIAPVHVVELVNIPPELRLESRGYSRSGHSGSPSLRPDSSYSYVGYESHSRRRVRSYTMPWMVSLCRYSMIYFYIAVGVSVLQ